MSGNGQPSVSLQRTRSLECLSKFTEAGASGSMPTPDADGCVWRRTEYGRAGGERWREPCVPAVSCRMCVGTPQKTTKKPKRSTTTAVLRIKPISARQQQQLKPANRCNDTIVVLSQGLEETNKYNSRQFIVA